MNKKLFIASMLIMLLNINANTQNLTGDPWIFQAYKELYGRSPTAFELNINNYNLGSWNSYPELKKYIQEFQGNGYNIKVTTLTNDRSAAVFYEGNDPVAIALISNKGGGLISENSTALISVDHARLIGSDHATLNGLPLVSFTDVNSKSLLGVSKKSARKASGRGKIVFKKR